jgi:hypothetical protein
MLDNILHTGLLLCEGSLRQILNVSRRNPTFTLSQKSHHSALEKRFSKSLSSAL